VTDRRTTITLTWRPAGEPARRQNDFAEIVHEAQAALALPMVDETPVADSPFNAVMKTWARWMTLTDQQHSSGLANPQDVKEFMACGEAVDVMVSDLPIHHRWAVRRAYGLATAWIYPERSLAETLVAAEAILSVKMLKNVATRRYFR
jgi:hypothetical protein